jgi:hypothetical protein
VGNWLQNLTAKLRPGAAEAAAGAESRNTRVSLALEQFVPWLTEVDHPSVLDLGCVWQATVNFFTQAGCKLYTEDLFKALSVARAETLPEAPPLTQRFLANVLQHPEENFRGILAWDLFDYLPGELVEPLAARFHALLEPEGMLLLLCHKRPEGVNFTRYRVLDARTLELLPGSLPLSVGRTYANRDLLKLFAAFRSARNFVGRDNLRELFLVK